MVLTIVLISSSLDSSYFVDGERYLFSMTRAIGPFYLNNHFGLFLDCPFFVNMHNTFHTFTKKIKVFFINQFLIACHP
jgi:hypothetical protein